MKKDKEQKKNKHGAREDVSSDGDAATAVDAAPVSDAEQPMEPTVEADPVKALEARVATLEDSLLRAKADYQNLLRRSAQERMEAVRFANVELMRSLLVVADDFERALEATKTMENGEAIADGIRLVYDNFSKALRDHGLEAIEALHQPFDPAVHQALLQQPTDEHPPGTVVEEVARGYRLQDRVVRASKVVVAKAPEDASSDEPAGSDGAGNEDA